MLGLERRRKSHVTTPSRNARFFLSSDAEFVDLHGPLLIARAKCARTMNIVTDPKEDVGNMGTGNMGTDGTFPDFLSCGSRKSREGGDCGIPPLRKRPRKDGAPGTRHWSKPGTFRLSAVFPSFPRLASSSLLLHERKLLYRSIVLPTPAK